VTFDQQNTLLLAIQPDVAVQENVEVPRYVLKADGSVIGAKLTDSS